jgi:hypothetical protein
MYSGGGGGGGGGAGVVAVRAVSRKLVGKLVEASRYEGMRLGLLIRFKTTDEPQDKPVAKLYSLKIQRKHDPNRDPFSCSFSLG